MTNPSADRAAAAGGAAGVAGPTTYRAVKVGGLSIFYCEAGRRDAPTILLLHGFPALCSKLT
jgi:hypothetical protein